jgi:hypothetical protein
MSRILGGVGQALARLLDIDGGRVKLDELRDSEGASIVTDLMPLLRAEALRVQTRGFGSTLNQSSNTLVTIVDVPVHHRISGIEVATTDATRLVSVHIFLQNIGSFGAAVNSMMLWFWENGDPTTPQPPSFNVNGNTPAALGTLLTPPLSKQSWRNFLYVDRKGSQKVGIERYAVVIESNAFGAGTVSTDGHIVQHFPASLLGPQSVEIPIDDTIS